VVEGSLRLFVLAWMPHRIKKFRLSANIIDCAEGTNTYSGGTSLTAASSRQTAALTTSGRLR
jgi:hypothetical protein